MIKIENIETSGWELAVRGIRNSYDSHDKSDSVYLPHTQLYLIGDNDMKLIKTLIKSGSSHRKFLRQIQVGCDITAPLYWWKQFDTYKVGVTANSESTMHTITSKELTIDNFSCEHLYEDSMYTLKNTITRINHMVSAYKMCEVQDKQRLFENIIQLLPSSFNQKRTVTMTLESLYNMILQRKGHKLIEWSHFIDTMVSEVNYLKAIMEVEV